MCEDKHEDHKKLSKCVIKYSPVDVYGFIVQTDALSNYYSKNKPDLKISLTNEEFCGKIKLADNYITQKHFLPNVIRRGAYRTERFWRIK